VNRYHRSSGLRVPCKKSNAISFGGGADGGDDVR
jgi:hypothetical protein